jgi:hypothetical protein
LGRQGGRRFATTLSAGAVRDGAGIRRGPLACKVGAPRLPP